jgi:hypothetical protein
MVGFGLGASSSEEFGSSGFLPGLFTALHVLILIVIVAVPRRITSRHVRVTVLPDDCKTAR